MCRRPGSGLCTVCSAVASRSSGAFETTIAPSESTLTKRIHDSVPSSSSGRGTSMGSPLSTTACESILLISGRGNEQVAASRARLMKSSIQRKLGSRSSDVRRTEVKSGGGAAGGGGGGGGGGGLSMGDFGSRSLVGKCQRLAPPIEILTSPIVCRLAGVSTSMRLASLSVRRMRPLAWSTHTPQISCCWPKSKVCSRVSQTTCWLSSSSVSAAKICTFPECSPRTIWPPAAKSMPDMSGLRHMRLAILSFATHLPLTSLKTAMRLLPASVT